MAQRATPHTAEMEIEAFELFMAVHQQPGDQLARARLLAWLDENPVHWQAFRALDQRLLDAIELVRQMDAPSSDQPLAASPWRSEGEDR